MSGVFDPLYVEARSALLDATEALSQHLDAIVLVGAQAVYMHTGDADFAVAEYTTDADLSLQPGKLLDSPLLSELLEGSGFTPGEHPGGWKSRTGVVVDLMVPEALAGPGRRGTDLGVHGRRVARRAKGLEGALVDRNPMVISSLGDDGRSVHMLVAGPAALLVAKVHKIAERRNDKDRLRDKDALDVLRLLRATSTDDLATRTRALITNGISAEVTHEAIGQLSSLFGDVNAVGVRMMLRAAGSSEDEGVLAQSMTVLVEDLQAELQPPTF